jgi:septal ring factor EnvC (AmiA/AmiB activator)
MYLEGFNDGQKKMSDEKYTDGFKAGRALVSSEKDRILMILILSLSVNFFIYMTNKKKAKPDSTLKSDENSFDLEKRIINLKDKLDTANTTINKANERIHQLKVLLDQKANSEKSKLVLEKRIESLSQNIQKLSKENSKLKLDIKNVEVNDINAYLLLGVNVSNFDITKAKSNYKKLSQIYHPDKSGSQEMMKKLNEAYDRLKK